jgi:hypothetical protein
MIQMELRRIVSLMKERRETRRRVFKGATIIQGMATSEIACVIRNQTHDGAELELSAETAVPKRFQLYVPTDGIAYDCELRWRRSDRLGVEILAKGPKPRFHYG